MTAGTSQPTATVPPWNPQKQAAPTPPTGQEAQAPTSSQSSAAGPSGGTNFPDVTAGIRDLYEVEQRNDAARDETASDLSVVPDYPLDSLPRNASARQAGEPQVTRITAGEARPGEARTRRSSGGARTGESAARTSQSSAARSSQTSSGARTSASSGAARTSGGGRTRHSSGGARPTQRTGSSSVPPTSVVPSSTNLPPPPHTVLRTSGDMPPPHAVRSSRAIVQQPVSHSNVSVSVNHPAADPRHIRTQDLSVGVVSRLEQHSRSGNMLPDVVAHSQPQSSSNRPPTNLPRTSIPPQDPRYSQGHRHHDSRQRPRHHRDQRYSRSHRHSRRRSHSEDDAECKDSCLKCVAVTMSFRWILVVLSLLGVCCVITGIILAALHAAGNSFLFLAIMFIGLGVLLVVVVGVGWKCTPRGHEPLHALFGIGDFRQRRSRRQRGHHRRDGRWHGGAMYPEFQYPRPPPTYDASMREYQQQQQQLANAPPPDLYDPDDTPAEDYSLPSSPPPSYRSRASTVRAGIQITFPPSQGGDFPDSRPPTYRSHPSNTLPGHGRTRPSLSRDEDDDEADVAPADVAFTGSSVVVDTNANQTTSIQIDAAGAPAQNVTVSVTTVSVTTQSAAFNSQPGQSVSAGTPPAGAGAGAGPSTSVYAISDTPAPEQEQITSEAVDAVGDVEGDRVDTAL